jgi:hypothetical protein
LDEAHFSFAFCKMGVTVCLTAGFKSKVPFMNV